MRPNCCSTKIMQTKTSYKLVLPFYLAAALAFSFACGMLLANENILHLQHAHPILIGITHTMTLGWGSMIILGAAHQLIPVLAGSALYSNTLVRFCFFACFSGIILLLKGLYVFDTGASTQLGALLFIAGIISYCINLICTCYYSTAKTFQCYFLIASAFWLLLTSIMGYLQLVNFSYSVLPQNSFRYLSVHAHMGFLGWFALTIIGTATKLLPMFLLSKYQSPALLRILLFGINVGIILFILGDLYFEILHNITLWVLVCMAFCFLFYCYKIITERIKKHIELPILLSLLFPVLFFCINVAVLILTFSLHPASINLPVVYGFIVLFGMISSIAIGMAFKTLPFIIWNAIFKKHPYTKSSPATLYKHSVFKWMAALHTIGVLSFLFAALLDSNVLNRFSCFCLFVASLLLVYNFLFSTLTLLHVEYRNQ